MNRPIFIEIIRRIWKAYFTSKQLKAVYSKNIGKEENWDFGWLYIIANKLLKTEILLVQEHKK